MIAQLIGFLQVKLIFRYLKRSKKWLLVASIDDNHKNN